MHDESSASHHDIKTLLAENQRLLKENHRLLVKMEREARIGLIIRVVWFTVLIGAPIALYYLFLEPNVATLTESLRLLQEGATNVTGVRQFLDQLPASGQ
jgi:hypothetical protein